VKNQAVRIWNSLRGKGKKDGSPRLPSLLHAMSLLSSQKVVREVIASSHDRRQWGVLAAASLGMSEREFVRRAATALKIEFQERVVPVDLSEFGGEARAMFESFRRVGALPILEGKCAKRFVAVDPAEVLGLELFDGSQQVSIATWSELSRSLDATEQLLSDADSAREVQLVKREEELCHRIFEVLLSEAQAHGATALDVISSEEGGQYQFTSESGHIGMGRINRGAVSGLVAYLCSRPGNILHSSLVGPVVIRMMATSTTLHLSWGVKTSDAKVAVIPVELEMSQDRSVTSLNSEKRAHSFGPADLLPQKEDSRPTVLVVDDNLMFGRVLEKLLRREGFEPLFATNGAEAYELLSQAKALMPQVIVCDLHMPVMNGRDFLSRVKGDVRFRSIPVVMLTSDDDIEAEIGLLEAGAEAFVSKSKDPRILCAQIRKLARKSEVREAA
jgi:CheY-like chemotaxis protein